MLIETVFVLYLISMIAIGVYEYRRTRGILEFYLAGKRLGSLIVSFSFFATYFSTAAFLGGGGFGFVCGFQWSSLLAFFHILFAILAWIVIAPKLKDLADRSGVLTIPEIFRARYGYFSQIIAATIILIFFEFYMVSIYKGSGNLLETMLNVDYRTALLITAAIVVFYTAIGGFRAVVVTDLIQGIIVLIGGITLFLTLLFILGGFDAISALQNVSLFGGLSGKVLFEFGKIAPPPIVKTGMVLPFILSLTFAISIAQLSSPQLIIRFIAARDERVLSYGMLLTPVLIGVFALCVFSIGPFGWLIIPKYADPKPFLRNPDLVIPFIAMKVFPSGINALILTAIVAAAMSTINSLLHVVSTSFVRDLIQNMTEISERYALMITRISVFVFAIIPLIIALKPPGLIVEIVGLSFSVITSAFLIPLLAALYSNDSSSVQISSSMISAVLACGVWYFFFYKKYWVYPVVPGLIASATVYYIFKFLRGWRSDRLLCIKNRTH